MGLVKSQVKAEVIGEDVSGSAALQKFSNSIAKTAQDAANASSKGSTSFRSFATQASSSFGSIADGLESIIKKTALAIAGSGGLGAAFVKSASDFEQNRVAFDTMLGSADAARKMMQALSDFAVRTPFQLPEVVSGAKQLLAYGISADKILPTFEALGNIAAGVGKDKLPFLTLAFGQVATKGHLAGQEIRQFTEAGVPLVAQLAKVLGKTKEQIVAMSEAGQIGFADVEKAIFSMSGSGGKFFQLMDRQSKTFGGTVSNIQDQFGRLARSALGISETGDIREGSIFAMLSKAAMRFLQILNDASPQITAFINMLVRNLNTIVAVLGGVVAAFIAAKIAAIAFAIAASINPISLLAAAIVVLIGVLTFLQIRFDIFGKLFRFLRPVIVLFSDAITDLWASLNKLGKLVGEALAPAFEFLGRHMEAVKAVGEVLLALVFLPLISVAATLYAAIRLLAVAADFVSDHWLGLKQVLSVVFAPVIEAIQIVIRLLGYLKDHVDDLKNAFNTAKETVTTFVDTSKRKINELWQFILRIPKDIREAFKDTVNFFEKLPDRIGKFMERLPSIILGVMSKAAQIMIDYDLDTLSRWGDNIEKMAQSAGKLGGKIVDRLSGSAEAIGSWFSQLPNKIGGSVGTAVSQIAGFFGAIPSKVGNYLGEAANNMINFFTQLPSSVAEFATTAADSIGNFFGSLPTKIGGFLENIVGNITSFFSALPGRISAWVSGAGDAVGKNTADGISNALSKRETIDRIGLTILGVIVGAIGLILGTILIFMADMGMKLIQGLINGIVSLGKALWNALSDIFGNIGKFVAGIGNWLWDAGRALISGFINGIKSMFNDVKGTLGDLTKKIKDWKGPIDVDKKLLVGAGQSIIGGFISGLESQYGAVKNSLSGLTSTLSPNISMSGQSASDNTQASTASTEINKQAPQNINITIQAQAFAGSQIEARRFAQQIMGAYNDAVVAQGM